MRRGGYRYGGAGGYRGEPSGRNDGRSGGGPPQGGVGRGYHHPPQPHNDPDTRRGRYRDRAGPAWVAGESVHSRNSPPDPVPKPRQISQPLPNMRQKISFYQKKRPDSPKDCTRHHCGVKCKVELVVDSVKQLNQSSETSIYMIHPYMELLKISA